MLTVRKSADRGHADHGWLDTYHTFSFGQYYDRNHMGFRSLRVINDDRVAPGAGFGTHPHDNMEIITYVVDGAIEHKDSMGNTSVIRPGEVQRMTAGTGITHSEFNPSPAEPLRLIQIWIRPEARDLEPGYEQRAFPLDERSGVLVLVASRDGRDGSVVVHQDVSLHAGRFAAGHKARLELDGGRYAWVQVVRGELAVNGVVLAEGDGLAVEDERALELRARSPAEVLVFDLG